MRTLTDERSAQMMRELKPEEAHEANRLFELAFNCKRSMAVWRWKFEKSPLASHRVYTVAEGDGRIVAASPLIAMPMKFGEMDVIGGQALDTCVSPTARGGLGIMLLKEMVELCLRKFEEKGFLFGFGFPDEDHLRLGTRFVGYREVGRVCLMRRRLSPAPLVANLTRSATLSCAAGIPFRMGWRLKSLFRKKRSELRIEEIGSFDERFDDLWERAKATARILTRRQSSYLKWRYGEHPENHYETIGAFRGDRLEGYAVLKTECKMARDGYLADILAGNEEVACELLAASLNRFASSGVDTAFAWALKHHYIYRSLARFGFREVPPGIPIAAMTLHPDCEEILFDIRNWYVTLGDSDGV